MAVEVAELPKAGPSMNPTVAGKPPVEVPVAPAPAKAIHPIHSVYPVTREPWPLEFRLLTTDHIQETYQIQRRSRHNRMDDPMDPSTSY